MPPGEVEVEPAALTAHAAHVDMVADEVGTAQWAGQAVRLDVGAYGKLCIAVPMLLGWLQETVIDAIGTAEQSLHDSGDRLRQTAAEYRASDQEAQARINRAGGL